ncbi:hypothetical protein AAG906_039048 [Vitis piasezkii]
MALRTLSLVSAVRCDGVPHRSSNSLPHLSISKPSWVVRTEVVWYSIGVTLKFMGSCTTYDELKLIKAATRQNVPQIDWQSTSHMMHEVFGLVDGPRDSPLFPSGSIWRASVPPKVIFFAWEASWRKVLTLDQLQRRGHFLANRCFLCLSEVKMVDHLLLHCAKTRVLWNLLFSLVGVAWILSCSVKETLLGWHGAFVGKARKKA